MAAFCSPIRAFSKGPTEGRTGAVARPGDYQTGLAPCASRARALAGVAFCPRRQANKFSADAGQSRVGWAACWRVAHAGAPMAARQMYTRGAQMLAEYPM